MHEYSIASALKRTVEEHARAAGGTRVVSVDVRVGAAAGVDADLLANAWGILRTDGPCEDAALRLHLVPEIWKCPGCGNPIEEGSWLRCPSCGVAAVLASGDELMLDRIEVERNP